MPQVTKTQLQLEIDKLNLLRVNTGRSILKIGRTEWKDYILTDDTNKIGFYFRKPFDLKVYLNGIIKCENEPKESKYLQVYNHREFAMCDYDNYQRPGFQLGEIVFKFRDINSDDETPEIGVIIQTYEDGEFRTEMFGNSSNSEVRYATIEDVKMYRPRLLNYIIQK